MVAISRVFDVEGLWEVLGEVGLGSASDREVGSGDGGQGRDEGDRDGVEGDEEVPDSEDDLALLEDDFDIDAPPRPPRSQKHDGDLGTEIVIVDTMTHIINELFSRKEKVEGKLALSLPPIPSHSISIPILTSTVKHNKTNTAQHTPSSPS